MDRRAHLRHRDWLLLIGLPLYVLQVTGSSLVTAAVFIAGLLPTLLVGPLAGVLADRWERRRTLVVTSLAQAALLLPLLAVHGRGELWVIYLVIAAEAALAQLFDPAKNALLPSLVDRDQLVSANALVGLNVNLGRLLGSSLGGVVMVTAGLRGVVIGDTVSFLAGAVLIAWMRARPPVPARTDRAAGAGTAPGGLVRQWLDGLAVTWHSRQLRWSLVVSAVSAVAQGLFVVLFVLFVLFVTRTLHGGGAEVGLLRGVQGIGGVLVGALGARLSAGRLLAWSLLAFGLLDLAMWNAPALTTAEPLYLGAFIAAGILLCGVISLLALGPPGRTVTARQVVAASGVVDHSS